MYLVNVQRDTTDDWPCKATRFAKVRVAPSSQYYYSTFGTISLIQFNNKFIFGKVPGANTKLASSSYEMKLLIWLVVSKQSFVATGAFI